MKAKVHKLYDYINNLSFSKVIDLYNSLSKDIAEMNNLETEFGTEYACIYDYTNQEDAEFILSVVGIENFLKNLTTREREERAYYINESGFFCNPWEQFMERATEFIEYIENCNPLYYTNVRKAINPSVKVKVAISRTITNVVEVEAVDHADALDYVNKNMDLFDPFNVDENQIEITHPSLEVIAN